MILESILILMLLFLFYQDMKYRAVYWLLFPALLMLLFPIVLRQLSFAETMRNGLCNLAFIISQLLIVSIYFSIKKRRLINITQDYLGLGDVFFLFVIAFYFSPLNYIVFYMTSLVLVLLLAIVFIIRGKKQLLKIPLAGLQAILFLIILIVDWNNSAVNLNDDLLMLNLMDKWTH